MQRFKNILVHISPTDETQPALIRAAWLAKVNNARLTVIDVMDEQSGQAGTVLSLLGLTDQLDAVERERKNRLRKIIEPIRDGGLPVETIFATGKAFLEIIRATLRHGHDLVVKTVASEGILTRVFFGSVDMHLLRKCPTPLWLIKPGEPERLRRILVALDPNIEDGVKCELGFNLLQLGTSLAEKNGAELIVLHAWHAYEQETLRRRMEPQKFEEYMHAWEQESSKRTWRFVSAFQREIKPECIRLVPGDPGVVIPQFARDNGVDLVVMGTLGRLAQHGLFIGDTAERILNQLQCSVLAVKPQGFVSPVTLR